MDAVTEKRCEEGGFFNFTGLEASETATSADAERP